MIVLIVVARIVLIVAVCLLAIVAMFVLVANVLQEMRDEGRLVKRKRP